MYQPGASGDAVGITLTLVSIGFCALYTVLTRRLMLDDSSLNVVLAQQAAALVFAVALASVVELAGGTGWDLAGLGAGAWLGAAVSGILYYGLGFCLLRDRPASAPGVVCGRVPAAHPGIRGRGRLPGRGAARAAAVARRRRHRGRDRRDRDPPPRLRPDDRSVVRRDDRTHRDEGESP